MQKRTFAGCAACHQTPSRHSRPLTVPAESASDVRADPPCGRDSPPCLVRVWLWSFTNLCWDMHEHRNPGVQQRRLKLSVRGHVNIQHTVRHSARQYWNGSELSGGRWDLCSWIITKLKEGNVCALHRCMNTTACVSQDWTVAAQHRKLCVLLLREKRGESVSMGLLLFDLEGQVWWTKYLALLWLKYLSVALDTTSTNASSVSRSSPFPLRPQDFSLFLCVFVKATVFWADIWVSGFGVACWGFDKSPKHCAASLFILGEKKKKI